MPRNRNPTQIGKVYGKAALNAFFFIPQIDFLSFISTLYFTFSVCDCQECVLSFFCNRFHHKSVYKNRHMFHVKHIAVRYYNYTFFNSRFSSSMTVSPSFISLSYSSLSLCRRLISCPSSFSKRTTDISSASGCRSSHPKSISSSILSTLHFTISV